MSLLSKLFGQSPAQPQQPQFFNQFGNMLGMAQKFKEFSSNPIGALMGMNPNLNIPQNLANNPEAVVKHLISTGQMTQQTFDQLSQTANQLQSMLPKF